jgi:hypothetical protein
VTEAKWVSKQVSSARRAQLPSTLAPDHAKVHGFSTAGAFTVNALRSLDAVPGVQIDEVYQGHSWVAPLHVRRGRRCPTPSPPPLFFTTPVSASVATLRDVP